MWQLVTKFLGHVIPGVARPLHILWNEIIGFLFLIFALVAVGYAVRAIHNFDGDVEGLVRILMPGVFALVMGYFGVSSVLRARKISRS